MSRIQAALHLATARVDEAYRRLSDHCLTCPVCRADRRDACQTAWNLHSAWSRARREARR